jgi:VIT1/CCC1 family predicted Fe2+/Mn2+ transporter/rubrerythrin
MEAELEKPVNDRLVKAIQENWQTEKKGAATYRTLSEREVDVRNKAAFNELAEAEESHAALWESRLLDLEAEVPSYSGSQSGMADCLAYRIGGEFATLRRIELDERKDIARYARQIHDFADAGSIKVLNTVIADEKKHSRILRDLVRGALPPVLRNDINTVRDPQEALQELRAKRGRRSPASWIGDAIYGVNDGLGAIFGIVSGVSGATSGNSHYVLLSGLAGMIASALSMGSGAYLASKSEREIFEAEFGRKREEIEADINVARQELSLIYQTKGLPEEDADRMAEHLSRNSDQFLKTLAAEELNLTEDALSNPLVSAATGMLSTAVGAFVPIIPFFFLHGYPAVIAAAAVSLGAHFAVGAAKTLITVRSWWSSGFEMTAVGAVVGIVTYIIGLGLGHLGV